MTSLPPHERFKHIKSQYDVAVIGGGIYGAAVAWEAASRGLSVLLMEAGDFGSGTSANSLKTIHGGLRSLQRMDFREMREYIRERRTLLRIAPHLVSLMPCAMPTYSSLSKGKLFLGAGLKVYDFVAIDRNQGLDKAQHIPPCKIISRESFIELVPEFDNSGATGGACWTDAQAYNTERLVLSFIMSAKKTGADVFNYLKKKENIVEHGKIVGVVAEDRLTGDEITVPSRAVINCTGPWAVRDEQSGNGCRLPTGPEQMARAVNLVVNRKLTRCALGARPLTGLDGNERLLFIAPWRHGSIVGTWYYPGSADLDQQALSDTELSDCLSQINSIFPSTGLTKEDITLVHHGYQPADNGVGADNEPHIWRHTKIIDAGKEGSQKGLFWVQGVKLTTARATAVEVIGKLARYLNQDVVASKTDHTVLYGGNISSYQDYERRCQDKLSAYCSPVAITRLTRNYGRNMDKIISLYENDPSLAYPVPGIEDVIKAELKFVLENEMAYTLSDLVLRRTDIGSFACPGEEAIEYCANRMAKYYDWSEAQTRNNKNDLLAHYPVWKRNDLS